MTCLSDHTAQSIFGKRLKVTIQHINPVIMQLVDHFEPATNQLKVSKLVSLFLTEH